MKFMCLAKTETVTTFNPLTVAWKITFQGGTGEHDQAMISIVAPPDKAARFRVGAEYECKLAEITATDQPKGP